MTMRRRDSASKKPGPRGRQPKAKDYDGTFDRDAMYEIEAFARALGITRQDVVDRFLKRGLASSAVGEMRFILGEEFHRFLAERQCGWGETPNSNREV